MTENNWHGWGIGSWAPTEEQAAPMFEADALGHLCQHFREPVYVVREQSTGRVGAAAGGQIASGIMPDTNGYLLLAILPALHPEWLGDRSFAEAHGVRFPYVTGAMANGIATPRLVLAMAEAGMLGFYGAAGLSFERVSEGIDQILEGLQGRPLAWGANLIHSPNEPSLEERVAAMFIQRGVTRVSASAYMKLTPAIVHYACSGLHIDPWGQIARKHHVFAKISRTEVAAHFMSPAPQEMLQTLVQKGRLTPEEARLAAFVPIAEDITVESDSGGHTDNRPLGSLFPTILAQRNEMMRTCGYTRPIRVGAAGGMGTPAAVASAFALGAAYVLTGSINQGALESGISDAGKLQLAQADLADVIMAPAADMFELGVKVQVLKRGTMFASRASWLYEIYRTYEGLHALPPDVLQRLESQIFRASVAEIWSETHDFWAGRDPHELARARKDPKHQMALVFRWYLGKSSRWAIAGDASRAIDYQLWCGPAMGAFNQWAKGSFLEDVSQRSVVQIAYNLLEGAAAITRAQQLRSYGAPIPSEAFDYRPRVLSTWN